MNKSLQLRLKKLFDFVFGMFFLIFFSPLILLGVFLVLIDSPGPAFFAQERIGRNRKKFICYKLRSMYTGSSDKVHREYIKKLMREDLNNGISQKGIYKLQNDDRITCAGRIMRRLSIDEFPQLFNVVKGDMSLVGPRPAIEYELEFYTPDMLKRFSANPGITGLWQVGGRSGLTYRQMVEKDLLYIQDWSFWLDLKILMKTALYILNISRAY